MASWIGPTVAIAVAVIALCFVAIGIVLYIAIREAQAKTESLAKELSDLRGDLAPALASINHLGETGSEVAELAREEIGELIRTSQQIRHRIDRGIRHAEGRLADLDALLEIATDEAEATLLDVASAVQSVRTSAGIIGHIGRFLAPHDEPEEDDTDDEDDEDEE